MSISRYCLGLILSIIIVTFSITNILFVFFTLVYCFGNLSKVARDLGKAARAFKKGFNEEFRSNQE
jgi:Sec-independent protein translocase protein TatA